MAESLTLDKDNKLPKAQDYNFLSSEATRLIQSLSGEKWTDYNTHDPGITLLEAMCYALTDLGYRSAFDMQDILAPRRLDEDSWKNIFYTARQILPSCPLTLMDYRKLVIDTEGVRNAWIEKSDEYEILMYVQKESADAEKQRFSLTYEAANSADVLRLRGLYKVFVEYEDYVLQQKKEDEIATVIRRKLQSNRNLCEDFISVTSIEYEDFAIDSLVQVNEGSDIELISAKIFKVINDFFSPPVSFYSLEQMLEKHGSADEIFNGPALNFGFIEEEELERSERFRNIHLSDIINLISGVPGVIAVKKFSFGKKESSFIKLSEWMNNVSDMQKRPRLDINNSVLAFVRSGDRHRSESSRFADKVRAASMFSFLQSADMRSRLKGVSKDLFIPRGEYMEIAEYFPFQQNLPVIYGMTEDLIDEKLGRPEVTRTISELLEFKTGGNFRRLLMRILSDDNADGALLQSVKDLLATSPESTDAAVTGIVSIIVKNQALYTEHIEELFGKIPERVDAELWLMDIVRHQSGQQNISPKSRIIATLANTSGSLLDLMEVGDLTELKQRFIKTQTEQLSAEKKTTLQLRAFLMVFEQIMSDHLAQLSNTREIFSFDISQTQNFYTGVVNDIKDIEALFIDERKYRHAHLDMLQTAPESAKSRNAILDHLLARFSETFEKYNFFMKNYQGAKAEKRLIGDKVAFLSDYEEISAFRGRSFDYTNEAETWNSKNVEGLKKRICRLLGIRNYSRRTVAPGNISVKETVVDASGYKRWYVLLTDPKDVNVVLLQSIAYQDEGEARQILNYILENGTEKSLYQQERKKEKFKYQLQRKTLENDMEVVAESIDFHGKDDRDKQFDQTIKVLQQISDDENFHIIEHVLLRPKIEAREAVTRRSTVTANADKVDLLTVRNVPDKINLLTTSRKSSGLQFQITQEKSGKQGDVVIWKLRLTDADETLLDIPEGFTFFRHLTRRIKHIREFGSDMSNYLIKTKDGKPEFTIEGPDRMLAQSVKKFRNRTELDAAIEKLVNFFSFESKLVRSGADDDSLGFHADPYSLQISIVIPDWPQRFRSPAFKHLLEKTIYLETPSHIHPHIYWLDHRDMQSFETQYRLWIEQLQGPEIPDTDVVNKMISAINKLRKV